MAFVPDAQQRRRWFHRRSLVCMRRDLEALQLDSTSKGLSNRGPRASATVLRAGVKVLPQMWPEKDFAETTILLA